MFLFETNSKIAHHVWLPDVLHCSHIAHKLLIPVSGYFPLIYLTMRRHCMLYQQETNKFTALNFVSAVCTYLHVPESEKVIYACYSGSGWGKSFIVSQMHVMEQTTGLGTSSASYSSSINGVTLQSKSCLTMDTKLKPLFSKNKEQDVFFFLVIETRTI